MGIPPGVHAPPTGIGMVDDPLVQVEPVQVSPVQQSDALEHAVPDPWHDWQSPPVHVNPGLLQ